MVEESPRLLSGLSRDHFCTSELRMREIRHASMLLRSLPLKWHVPCFDKLNVKFHEKPQACRCSCSVESESKLKWDHFSFERR